MKHTYITRNAHCRAGVAGCLEDATPPPEGSGGNVAGGTPGGGGPDGAGVPHGGTPRCSVAEMLKRTSLESTSAVDAMGTSTAPGTEEGIFSARSSPTFAWDEGDVLDDDFALPPPAVPLDPCPEDDDAELSECEGGLPKVDTNIGPAWWSSDARLPQLRTRTICSYSPKQPPLLSHPAWLPGTPLTPLSKTGALELEAKQRAGPSKDRRATPPTSLLPIGAQLNEGATGVEGVLNCVRFDLLDVDGFVALIDNEERPTLCRPFVLCGACDKGQACRHQHTLTVPWLSGATLPPESSGGHVANVEALELHKLFWLLDRAPSPAARHALLQTVAFLLYRGELVWCRHVGRAAAAELWEFFLDVRACSEGAVGVPK